MDGGAVDPRDSARLAGAGSARLRTGLPRVRLEQVAWKQRSIPQRLQVIRRFRHLLASHLDDLIDVIQLPQRFPSETLVSEILPLADACRFLEANAARVLQPPRVGRHGRPLWSRTLVLERRRVPLGVVLIVGPSNFPILSPGVQTLQALTAGNGVLLKPGHEGRAAAELMQTLLIEAGLPADLLHVTSEEPRQVVEAVEGGVDHIVLTGSSESGSAVAGMAGPALIPTAMELSGCDACFILPSANVELAARAVAFGMTWNGSATRLAPRRVLIHRSLIPQFEEWLRRAVASCPPRWVSPPTQQSCHRLIEQALEAGATSLLGTREDCDRGLPVVLQVTASQLSRLQRDIFGPVALLTPFDSEEEALALDAECPWALGATVFGISREARRFARRVQAGCVIVNDMMVPSSDPALPFAPARRSGWGVTRGAEGLLAMTRLQVVAEQRSRWRPHLDQLAPPDPQMIRGWIRLMHGQSWSERWQGLWQLVRAIRHPAPPMTPADPARPLAAPAQRLATSRPHAEPSTIDLLAGSGKYRFPGLERAKPGDSSTRLDANTRSDRNRTITPPEAE